MMIESNANEVEMRKLSTEDRDLFFMESERSRRTDAGEFGNSYGKAVGVGPTYVHLVKNSTGLPICRNSGDVIPRNTLSLRNRTIQNGQREYHVCDDDSHHKKRLSLGLSLTWYFERTA